MSLVPTAFFAFSSCIHTSDRSEREKQKKTYCSLFSATRRRISSLESLAPVLTIHPFLRRIWSPWIKLFFCPITLGSICNPANSSYSNQCQKRMILLSLTTQKSRLNYFWWQRQQTAQGGFLLWTMKGRCGGCVLSYRRWTVGRAYVGSGGSFGRWSCRRDNWIR